MNPDEEYEPIPDDEIGKFDGLFEEDENLPWNQNDKFESQEYVKKILGLASELDEDQLTLAAIICDALAGSKRNMERGFFVQSINGQTDAKNISKYLVDTITQPNGIIDFVQDWAALAVKNELVLYSANKESFDDLIKTIKQNNSPNTEISSLQARVGDTEGFSTHINGNTISWEPSPSAQIVLGEIIGQTFANGLTQLKENFWTNTIFTFDFFKNKIFSQTDENKTAKNIQDLVRTSEYDVNIAANILEINLEDGSKLPSSRVDRKENVSHPYRTNSYNYDLEISKEKSTDIISKDEVKKGDKNNAIGRIFEGMVQSGVPIATIRNTKIFKGLQQDGYPIGNFKNQKVWKGLVEGGFPLATIRDKRIYKGMVDSGYPIAHIERGRIYLGLASGFPIATYVGDNEDEGLAAAFLLGLLNDKT